MSPLKIVFNSLPVVFLRNTHFKHPSKTDGLFDLCLTFHLVERDKNKVIKVESNDTCVRGVVGDWFPFVISSRADFRILCFSMFFFLVLASS